MVTRRTLLALGAGLGVSGCVPGPGPDPATSATPTASPTVVTPSATSTARPTPTPNPRGVHSVLLAAAQVSPKGWALGPKTVALTQKVSGAPVSARFYSSGGARTVAATATPARTQRVFGYAVGVEGHPDAPPGGVEAYLTSASSGGLDTSARTLEVVTWDPEGPSARGRFNPAGGDSSHLSAVTMCNGITCVAVAFRDDDNDRIMVQRVAFSRSGAELWNRTDRSSDGQENSALGDHDLTSNMAGEFVFGVNQQLVGVDPRSGENEWTVNSASGKGITHDSDTVLVLGNGKLVDKATGKQIGRVSSSSSAIDPIEEYAALAYPEDDDSSSPAYEVVRVPSGDRVFQLSRDDAEGLGQIRVVAAFDGRVVLAVQDGVRVVNGITGNPDPEFARVPQGAFRMDRVPALNSPYWALLGTSNGFGEVFDDFITTLIYGTRQLTWSDIDMSLQR